MSPRAETQMEIPYPPNREQRALIGAAVENKVVVASAGTDRYEMLNKLTLAGYFTKRYCPKSLGVFQFEPTRAGVAAIQQLQPPPGR